MTSAYSDMPLGAAAPPSVSVPPPLCAVLGGPDLRALAANGDSWQYGGQIQTVTKLGGKTDVTSTPVLYVVEVPQTGRVALMKSKTDVAHAISQAIQLNPGMVNELTGYNRRHTNNTGYFDKVDLSAAIERCVMGLALFASSGKLTHDDLLGGRPLNVTVLASVDESVTASRSSVFVPRSVDTQLKQAAFAALVYCINGTGSQVVTDVLSVTANGAVNMLQPTGSVLAMGCFQAVRVMMNMYSLSDEGSVAAFAVCTGVMKMITVNGHTDEGSYMRKVLRRTEFAPSYGAIYSVGSDGYLGLPVPNVSSQGSFVTLINAMALKFCAAVAVCAPVEVREGRTYPMIFASRRGGVRDPSGAAIVGTSIDSAEITTLASDNCQEFAHRYVGELARLMMVRSSGKMIAETALIGAFNSLAGADIAQLRRASANVFFMIEPSCLYEDVQPTPANLAGFGVLCGTSESVQKWAFEGDQRGIIRADGISVDMAVPFRSARTNPIVMHLMNSKSDGLACMIPLQFVDANMSMIRASADAAITTTVGRTAVKEDLASYMWSAGDSKVPKPHEVMYLGAGIGFKFGCASYDADYGLVPTHFYSQEELTRPHGAGPVITMSARRPVGVAQGNRASVQARRNNVFCTALLALNAARYGARMGFMAGTSMMYAANIEPAFFGGGLDDMHFVSAGIGGGADGPARVLVGAPLGPPVPPVTFMGPTRTMAVRSGAGLIVGSAPAIKSPSSVSPGPPRLGAAGAPSLPISGGGGASSSSAAASSAPSHEMALAAQAREFRMAAAAAALSAYTSPAGAVDTFIPTGLLASSSSIPDSSRIARTIGGTEHALVDPAATH